MKKKRRPCQNIKKDGILILNADDDDALALKSKTKCRTLTYGFREGSDIVGSGVDILYAASGEPEGVIFRVDEEGTSFPVSIQGVFGRNHIYAALAAFALTLGLKLNMLFTANSLKNYEIAPGRMRLLKGVNDTMIIDDTYNSSPLACEVALQTLGEVKTSGRKVAVLGDMLEPWQAHERYHTNIGRVARENCDAFVVVGPRAQAIKEGASRRGMNPEKYFSVFEIIRSG